MTIQAMIGRTFVQIRGDVGDDELVFVTDNEDQFVFYHSQDCCEHVSINDITGTLDDLLNTPLLVAEESSSGENPEGVEIPEYQDSFTWTFYKFATIKGWVDVRWYGSSNGYYGEGVSLNYRAA